MVGSLLILLLVLPPVPPLAAEEVLVADELARLSEEHGFDVHGLAQTEETFGRANGEKLYPRLRLLLENFDHVIVQSPDGGVDRVIVLGEKVPFEPTPPPELSGSPGAAEGEDIVVQTKRRGTQHVVQVSLEGENGAKVVRELHLDTGADYLVLPQSLISKLGIDKTTLELRDMQTANGKVKARIGTLPALWLTGSRIADVETAFIGDEKLGEKGLLGMSVLRRYKLTVDDDKNRIILGRKGGDAPPMEDEAEATAR
jgi:clan AA aspartic protease (TIGR02281 family)